MKLLTIDIDNLDDFVWVLEQANTVCWVDVQNPALHRLFIVPTVNFPASYCHHAVPGTYELALVKFKTVNATLIAE
jgi:hypothetical protein